MTALSWIDDSNDDSPFPAVTNAMTHPNGLLAAGGTLHPRRLIAAYRQGIFPWYSVGQPILWWSPDPRWVLYPDKLKISRSLRKTMHKGQYHATMDAIFPQVVKECAAPRVGASGTWITLGMVRAYSTLHQLGFAHSVEVWEGDVLVGGLYGVSLGRIFFGESMFSRRSDASKVGFVHLLHQLRRWGFAVVDCQMHSEHLQRFGAEAIHRNAFVRLLDQHADAPEPPNPWRFDVGLTVSE